MNFENRNNIAVIGHENEAEKDVVKERIANRLAGDYIERIPKESLEELNALEYPKKPYERKAIEISNEVTNRILQRFGLNPFDVPESNFRIVPESLYKKAFRGSTAVATTIQEQQVVIVNAEREIEPILRSMTIFHEMLHMKNSIVAKPAEDSFEIVKKGFKILAKNDLIKLGTFNEAVVAEMEKRYFRELIIKNEYLSEEYKKQFSEEAERYRAEITEKNGIDKDELLYVYPEKKDYRGMFSYYEERRVLNYIAETILEDNQDIFRNKDEVMDVFFKSHFTGRMLEVGRLIKKSFGDGALQEIIAPMETGRHASVYALDLLKRRNRKIKNTTL